MPRRDTDVFGDLSEDYCPHCGHYTGGDSVCPNCNRDIFNDSGLEEHDEDAEPVEEEDDAGPPKDEHDEEEEE